MACESQAGGLHSLLGDSRGGCDLNLKDSRVHLLLQIEEEKQIPLKPSTAS